ncbi:sensor histidine kinase [Paenibacillus thermotolerans]|uniref:sensor histidine kinase n=1 Tax=Paenibacillus thermotolerans TaxID=3027807 RepID=UPI0023686CC2|nr:MULTISPECIES: ATP-binding protein [unclassified Paenibacillus]
MSEQLSIILMMFITSLPQTILFTYMGVVFFGFRLKKTGTSLIWNALFISGFTTSMLPFLPPVFRLSFSSTVFLLVPFIVFRELRRIERFFLAILVLILVCLNESVFGYLGLLLHVFNYEALLTDPRAGLVLLLPLSLIAGVFGWIMRRYRFYPGRELLEYIGKSGNHYLFWLLLLFAVNTLLSLIVFFLVMDSTRQVVVLGLSLVTLIGLSMFLITVRAMSRTREVAIQTTQEAYIDDFNNMFTAIRGQRHDFLNHVQVIQSFLKLGKYEELERYTKELVGEITDTNELLQIGHPAFAALIKSKMVQAMSRKIEFRHTFSGMERLNDGIASIDFVKIAGNLLDNALDEASNHPVGERWVEVKGWLDEDSFNMTVRNPSRDLTEEELRLLFVPGYSTKKKTKHSGLGLSIVKERVDHYKGAVDVKNAPDLGTTFVVKIPLQLRASIQR